MKKIYLLIAIFLLVLPIVFSFGGEGTTYSIESSTTAQQGKTGDGSTYSFRFTTTAFQPVGYIEDINYSGSIGWLNISVTNATVIVIDIIAPTISPVAISSITTNNADLAFTTSENCNYSIIYGFAVDSMPNSLTSSAFTTAHMTTFNTLLTYNSQYFFNITVWDNAGNSAESITYSFTTLDNPPVGGSEGGSSTGFDEEDEEEPIIIEEPPVYVNITNASIIDKVISYLELQQKTMFGTNLDEEFISSTVQFNLFRMRVKTQKKWKMDKETSIYIDFEDLYGRSINPDKLSVSINYMNGTIIDSVEEIKRINLGIYIANLKSPLIESEFFLVTLNKFLIKTWNFLINFRFKDFVGDSITNTILVKIPDNKSSTFSDNMKVSLETVSKSMDETDLRNYSIVSKIDEELINYTIEVNAIYKNETGKNMVVITVDESKPKSEIINLKKVIEYIKLSMQNANFKNMINKTG